MVTKIAQSYAMSFIFEKLEVYQLSLQWAEIVERFVEGSKLSVSASLRDQLSRAATSISLNIAEGNGRWHKAEKRNFFWIARGSTFECVAVQQILLRTKKISPSEFETNYALLERVAQMLTKLVSSVEKLKQ